MIKQYMSAMGVEEAHYQNGDFEVTTQLMAQSSVKSR